MTFQDLARYTGPPQSLIWRGGAVHLRYAAPNRNSPDVHAHFALQLSVAFASELSLRSGRRAPERIAPGWLIQSDKPHWMLGYGTVVTIFWDPVSTTGRLAATRLGSEVAAPLALEECSGIRDAMSDCWQRGWRHKGLRDAVDRIAHFIARPGAQAPPMDRRVRTVLRELQSDPAGKVSLAEFASLTKLSESHLAHLFRREVGLPVRQYRLGLRMEQAVQEIARGASLASAAYAAGFADPAQFCRICRRMFGSAPSNLPSFERAPDA